jgi:hypothetical protein
MIGGQTLGAGRRGAIALALSLGLGPAAGCGAAAGFACAGDQECSLAGVAGVCVESTSQCAYPDTRCAAGLSYPAGAGAELAGVCVDDDGLTGSSTGAGPTTGPPANPTSGLEPDSSGDAPVDPETSGTTTMSATTGPSATSSSGGADDPTTSGGEATTTGAPVCPGDPAEPNDLPEDAVVFGRPVGCEDTGAAVLDGLGDSDWFQYPVGSCFGSGLTLTIAPAGELVACAYYDGCTGGAGLLCPPGAFLDTVAGVDGCCSDAGDFTMAASCAEPTAAVYLNFREGVTECVEYEATLAAAP